jgi:dienelactone hydrolase
MRVLSVLVSLLAMTAIAKPMQKSVKYELEGTKFEGVLIYDDAVKTPRPGLVLVPNWMGINELNLKQAAQIASKDYIIFVADMYGQTVRPKTMDEASKAAGALKGDRKIMRARVNKALDVLKAEAKAAGLDAKKLGAIGFCFGGTTVIELARSGADVAGVVSFHGGLDASPVPIDSKGIKAKVLALHGADDPFVPAADVKAFEDEMRKSKVDWQLVSYGNAVHSFTDVDANMVGQAQYNEKVAKRSYKAMADFFAEAFGG